MKIEFGKPYLRDLYETGKTKDKICRESNRNRNY